MSTLANPWEWQRLLQTSDRYSNWEKLQWNPMKFTDKLERTLQNAESGRTNELKSHWWTCPKNTRGSPWPIHCKHLRFHSKKSRSPELHGFRGKLGPWERDWSRWAGLHPGARCVRRRVPVNWRQSLGLGPEIPQQAVLSQLAGDVIVYFLVLAVVTIHFLPPDGERSPPEAKLGYSRRWVIEMIVDSVIVLDGKCESILFSR